MLTTAALLILTSLPSASDTGNVTDPATFCPVISRTAGEIMRAHQVGVPLTRAMEIVGDDAFWRNIVLQAYSSPRYSTDENRRNAVTDFTTTVELACYKSFE